MPGHRVVILGSGDIGLIMARRMTLEGAKVLAVCEIMPYSGGLARNIAQCLDDFGIPLKLSHTVTEIHGRERVEAVTIAAVDEANGRRPIPGTEETIACDTLLLSVGLIPENELTRGAGSDISRATSGADVNQFRETSAPGIYACGNVLHVHDLVDNVSQEAIRAGAAAARFVRGQNAVSGHQVQIKAGRGVRYTVPQTVDLATMSAEVTVFFRVADQYRDAYLTCCVDGKPVSRRKKQIMTPGEMEQFILRRDRLDENSRVVEFLVEDA
jgi:NADPH-dependent 2,4-dienoyl-CoA reductase/sulfur reductase-like enzyme